MGELAFSWDVAKDATNQRKHGVSFDEARSAFFDPDARVMNDPDHSVTEERYILLGLSYKLRLLTVCHTYLRRDDEIRIVSARKAMRHETNQYTEQRL
jgi:uncharacterized DUF497 family protein